MTAKCKSDIITFTPKLAAEWLLTKNTSNRSIRLSKVRKYKQEMEEGQWLQTWEPILVDWNDQIISGQHRLHAIKESGVTLDMYVIFGLDPKVRLKVDGGSPRTFADRLGADGEANRNLLAAGTRFVWSYATKQIFSNGNPNGNSPIGTDGHLYQTLKEHPNLRASVRTYQMLQKRPGGLLIPGALAVGLHYLFGLVDQTKADLFFETLQSGYDIKSGNPIAALRARLIGTRNNSARLSEGAYFSLVVTTWNAMMKGKRLSRLAFTSGERHPEIEGLPKQLLSELTPEKETRYETTGISSDRRALLSAAR